MCSEPEVVQVISKVMLHGHVVKSFSERQSGYYLKTTLDLYAEIYKS